MDPLLEAENIRKRASLAELGIEAVLKLGMMHDASPEEITDFVLDAANKLTGSKAGFINLASEDEKLFTAHAYSKHIMEECAIVEKPIEFLIEEAGIWAEAVRQRKPVIINDYENTSLKKKGIPKGHVPLKKLLCVPVIDRGKITALGGFANKEEDYDEFDARQLSLLLEGMWRHIKRNRTEDKLRESEARLTLAVQKAEEEARLSSSLLNLASSIGGLLDTKSILQEVSKTALTLASSEKTAVLIEGPRDGVFKVAAHAGWPEHLNPVVETLTVIRGDMPELDKALLSGAEIEIPDAGKSGIIRKDIVGALNLRALLITPIMTNRGVTGFIMAERQQGHTEKERKVLKGIASITSASLENSMLYRESIETAADLARRIETLESTFAIDRAILSTLDRKEILEVVTKNIQRVIPADRVTNIMTNEDETGYFFGPESIPFGTCPALEGAIRAGRVVSVPDLSPYRHMPVIRELAKEGFGSFIALPLHSREKNQGCILMASRRIGAFDRDDIANGEKLTAQMSVAIDNAKLYEDIKELFLSTVRALANAIDAKSTWTKGHSERVTRYALLLAKEMGLSEKEIEILEIGGLLHDIGKIGTFDVVLDKPDKLTKEEFELVKKHPGKGVEILDPLKRLRDILPIVRHHHERLDGKGYPDGIGGNDIPLLARILCVTDSYDSMTADRPYRPAPGKDYALAELRRCSGTQFDPAVVNAFLRVVETF